MTKLCNGCGRTLPLEDFAPRTDRPGQRRPRCRACHNQISACWRARNPDYQRQWVKDNPAKVAAYLRARADRLAPPNNNTNDSSHDHTHTPPAQR